MKIYVTKYALTRGIQEFEAEQVKPGMARVPGCGRPGYVDQFFHGQDWHLDLESAKRWSVALRDAKIASLRKQIAKLEGTEF